MRSKLTTSDIFDVNKNTGGLILGKNRLDDYASKFLSRVCKEALTTPMPLPIEKILADAHLTVIEMSLSRNLDVFGCCLLLDGEVQVYNKETGSMEARNYPAGTILIDPGYVERYGEGAKRNTLIHEALHWEKDKRYFEILQIKNRVASEKLYPIMCRQSETYYEPPEGKKTKENEVRWLEWQAHRLAPRVLMPRDMFKKKALEIVEHPESMNIDLPLSCDILIEKISEFFLVSRTSAKYRLIEVGLETVISQFDDYSDVYAEILENKNYQPLSPVEAYALAFNDSVLREWINNGTFIDVDFLVISHGHYDHGGGLKSFLHENTKAEVFLHRLAFEKHYAIRPNDELDFIGLDENLKQNKQIVLTSDRFFINSGIQVFSNITQRKPRPKSNRGLLTEYNGQTTDDIFAHEQNLVIEEDGKTLLVTGCAHNGIINILEHFHTLKGRMPDYVIGGFHLSSRSGGNEDSEMTDRIVKYLLSTKAKFYTCHCTGIEPYKRLKAGMGDSIDYLSAGSKITI